VVVNPSPVVERRLDQWTEAIREVATEEKVVDPPHNDGIALDALAHRPIADWHHEMASGTDPVFRIVYSHGNSALGDSDNGSVPPQD
jgi:hypothetical protein